MRGSDILSPKVGKPVDDASLCCRKPSSYALRTTLAAENREASSESERRPSAGTARRALVITLSGSTAPPSSSAGAPLTVGGTVGSIER